MNKKKIINWEQVTKDENEIINDIFDILIYVLHGYC